MFRSHRKMIVLTCACLTASVTTVANAIDAVFIPGEITYGSNTGGVIEVQGFEGPFDMPVTIGGPAETSALLNDTVGGATASDNVLYTLLTSRTPGSNSIITEASASTGAYIGTITLSTPLSDIAYTNGQLYGVQSNTGNPSTVSVLGISSTGTTQTIATQNLPAYSANWRLSGVVDGDGLLLAPSQPPVSQPGYVLTPTAPSTPLTTFPLPNGGPIIDTVIHANGSSVTLIGPQTDYTYPGGVLIGPRNSNNGYAISSGGHISDEFNYNYSSSMPAQITLAAGPILFNITNGLYRLPQTLSGTETFDLDNGVAPDGATVSNYVASGLFEQNEGTPIPGAIQETDAGPVQFSATETAIAQATITINLANVPRGLYGFGNNSNITADYNVGGTVQHGRPVSVINYTFGQFAYDPVSSNLVGNGDGSLSGFGWETIDGATGGVFNEDGGVSNLGFGIVPTATDPQSLEQILQLPTANGPMAFSFDYDLYAGQSGNIEVLLNGTVIANLPVTSSSAQTYETEIDDPSLYNLSNADLTFEGSVGSSGTLSWIGLGSISLTAVPEPETFTVLGAAAVMLLSRRSRRKPVNAK